MKRMLAVSFTALVVLSGRAAPSPPHHAFAAVFDAEAPVQLTGVVTAVEWMNPHTWFYVDVENDNLEVQNWGFEMGSPNALVRRGWSRDDLEAGDVVTVAGFRAKDGTPRAAVRDVTLSTGERLFGAQETN
jgi:hypothetical protein